MAVNGRSLHDALLRALCEAPLRGALAADPARAAAALGSEEAAALARADGARLARLARFMARHFYRERLVRLFRHARAVLRRSGRDPIAVIDEPAFRRAVEAATLGGSESAGEIAALIEGRCRADAEEIRKAGKGGALPPYFEDLLRYEGALFRVEAGPRRWREGGSPGAPGGGPRLSPWSRIVDLEHDLPPILDAIEDAAGPLPPAERRPTRLLASLDPRGTVNVVRCPEGAARLIAVLDGRPLARAAEAAGVTVPQAEGVLDQLRGIGAVVT